MRFIFALAATALLAAAPALAADDAGFYVGAGVGSFGIDANVGEFGKFSGNDTSFKLLAGYDFMKFLGAEVEYLDGGSAEDTLSDVKTNIDVTGWNVSVVSSWKLLTSTT